MVLDLPLHHLIRGLQLQHGLRHGDFQRYRHYITRRLQRLRKLAKATHKGGGKGKDRAFVAKDVHTLASLGGEAAALKLEHLLLLVLNAERAWAFAMQIKQDGGGHLTSHVRAHLLRRFRRAAVWASRLQGLVGEVPGRVTERMALEVEAYAGWMGALVDVEQEQWATALAKLRTAHSILSRLGEVGSLEDQDLFSNKAEEVLQSVRYCQYNLGEGSLEDLKTGAEHVPQALRDKLEAVMEASRKQEATGLESVAWGGVGGRQLPVSSAEVRVALVKVAEASKGLAEAQEEQQYAQMYAAYDEALRRVAAEKDKVEGMSVGARVEAQKEELRLLASYLQHGRLETMRARNEGLVAGLAKTGRPEDLVHVYDALMQNVAEVLKLPGVEDVDPVLTKAQALQARYRAQRAFYLAEFYAATPGGKKLPEAMALFDLADGLAEAAVQETNEVSGGAKGEKEGMVREAKALKDLAAGGRYRTQALALLASLPAAAGGGSKGSEESALAAAMASLSLSAGDEGGKATKTKTKGKGKGKGKVAPAPTTTLLERLGELDGGKEASGFGIALVPATVTAVRAKPQLFDIAFNYLGDRLPDLAAKAGVPSSSKQKQNAAAGAGGGAGGGGLFGWLRG